MNNCDKHLVGVQRSVTVRGMCVKSEKSTAAEAARPSKGKDQMTHLIFSF